MVIVTLIKNVGKPTFIFTDFLHFILPFTRGIELRKKIHPLINLILKIDEVLSKEKNIIIANENNAKEGVPKIFACTHIGGNDIQRTFQIIKEPAYLMLGDPGILYRMPIYQGLKMNGVIPLETKNKLDRKRKEM